MSEATRPGLRALGQVAAAGAIGAVAMPLLFGAFVTMAWANGSAAALVVAGLLAALLVAALVTVAARTPGPSRLTETRGGQVGWALTVAGVGSVGWLFAHAVVAEAGANTLWFGFVPFALVAGLLLGQWQYRAGAFALSVASGFGLLAVLAGAVPDEVDARLAAAGLERAQVFVADIPGYHRVPQQRGSMMPDDPRVIPPARYVSLVVHVDDPTGDCQPHPNGSVLADAPCTVERPGLTYRVGVVEHEYFYRKGTVLLQLVGSLAVERDVLRDAVLAARPAGEHGSYTTEVAGFEGMAHSTGMDFRLTDRTLLPEAKNVSVSASAISDVGSCENFRKAGGWSPYLVCEAERPGLHYRRTAENHTYLARHGAMEVQVTGGLGVDRSLLRDAALTARPATDDELMTMLPPGPPPDRSTFMARLKGLAKDLFD